MTWPITRGHVTMEKASKMTDFWCLWSEIREKGEAKWVAKSDIYDQSHFYI